MSHYVSDPDARPVKITTYPPRPRRRTTPGQRSTRRDEVRYGDFFVAEPAASGVA